MNLLLELVVALFSLPGVSEVLRREQVTREYVVKRLADVARAIKDIKCKDDCEHQLLIGLLGRRIADVVMPGSTVNIPAMVQELHEDVHRTLGLIKAELGQDDPDEPVQVTPDPVTPTPNPEPAPVEEPIVDEPDSEAPVVDEPPVEFEPEPKFTVEDVRNASITALGLATRARNAFVQESLTTVGQIIDYSKAKPLSDIKGIGDEMAADTLEAIKKYAEANGVEFSDL